MCTFKTRQKKVKPPPVRQCTKKGPPTLILWRTHFYFRYWASMWFERGIKNKVLTCLVVFFVTPTCGGRVCSGKREYLCRVKGKSIIRVGIYYDNRSRLILRVLVLFRIFITNSKGKQYNYRNNQTTRVGVNFAAIADQRRRWKPRNLSDCDNLFRYRANYNKTGVNL